jgi:hypothetical protein
MQAGYLSHLFFISSLRLQVLYELINSLRLFLSQIFILFCLKPTIIIISFIHLTKDILVLNDISFFYVFILAIFSLFKFIF